MEIPIQVAVQICPKFPHELRCVETIPNYVDENVTNNNDSPTMGLVRISRPQVNVSAAAAPAVDNIDANDDVNGNPPESDANSTTFPIQYALPYGSTQEFLYQKCVQPMILDFLEGFDMSIVTYGQCEMGKTHTMYAKRFDEDNDDFGGAEPGIVVRAIAEMFKHLEKRPAGWLKAMKVEWFELCGDEIDDLLNGAIPCRSIDDVFHCLRDGSSKIRQRRRRSNSTDNIASVHNIFTISIEQQWITANGYLQHRESTASFCDLAGTQRQPSRNDQQLGESIPNDPSLQALERIVTTLCVSTPQCVPSPQKLNNDHANLLNQYKSTKLTSFLKDSFGGRAQTLMIFCVSPLARDAIETIQNLQFAYRTQFVWNKITMNAFSDNNKPIANYWDASPDINLLSKAIHFDGNTAPDYEKPIMNHCKITNGNGNGGGGQSAAAAAATLAGLKFANSQWLKLVANAEALFNKLLTNNNNKTPPLNEQDRECIEEWMYLKRECDDCFGAMIPDPTTNPSSIPHTLGPIQERNEPSENGCNDDDDGANANNNDGGAIIPMQKVIDSDGRFSVLNETDLDNESDMDQFEYVPERIFDLMQNFSCKMNEMVDQNYGNYVQNYPKGALQSGSDDDGGKKQQPPQPPSSPSDTAAANLPCVKTKRSNSVVLPGEAVAYPAGRRRSIHTAAVTTVSEADDNCSSSAIPNTAELARLNRLADKHIQHSQNSQTTTSSTNTVCREINEFLDHSDELHPLRMANRNRTTYETEIARLQSEIDENEKQQHDLSQTIKTETQLMKQCHSGKQNLKQKEEHLLQQKEKCEKALAKSRDKKKLEKLDADLHQIDKDLNDVHKIRQTNRDYEQHIEKSKKQLTTLKKDQKYKKKKLEKLQAEFAKNRKGEKITQLDCVLKEKRMYLQQQTNGENQYVESVRHEIRNLRSQRDRLNEQQWACSQKLNGVNQLNDREYLQYDVAKEVLDYAIEYKNQMISNKKSSVFVESPDLMHQLKRLSEKEMRLVLYKSLQKIVDLRKSTGFIENEAIRLEKELDKWKLRERSLSQEYQQFQLKANGFTLSLQNQYDKLLHAYAAGMAMRGNENAAAPLLMSPSRILHTKHQQHYRHQQQRAMINEFPYNPHDENDDNANGDMHDRRRNANQRSAYRMANANSALVAATPSIEPATTAFDSFQKQKPQKFNSFIKLLRHNPLMLTNHSHAAANPDCTPGGGGGTGRVTVDKNIKKIFIQQNKTH